VPTFLELQDDAALLSFEHQLHLTDTVGVPPWESDLAEARFSFTGDRPVTCTAVHFLGSAAPGPKSWLWSWANPSEYREDVLAVARQVRDFGQQHNIPELAAAEVPFDALPGSPTDPAHVTSLMMEATKVVTGRWTGYSAPVGGGTRVGFLLEHPTFVLPAPEGPRVSRVLQQGLMDLRLFDHRRAFHAYAVNRGLGVEHNGSQMRITGPGFDVVVGFNERNLVTAMSANLAGAQ
jgi:hypothetical protein